MGDGVIETVVDLAILVGIGVFMWSVASSLGTIAKALARQATSRESAGGTSQALA